MCIKTTLVYLPYQPGIQDIIIPGRIREDKKELLRYYKGLKSIVTKVKVTCLEGDTYNKELGEKMALAKARSKAYIKCRNIISEVLVPTLFIVNKVLTDCNIKLNKMHASEINYFNSLKNKQIENNENNVVGE
ncbi:MAG: hypothetical protein IK120_04195 [Muribaculaceae bacterium]|nr:hypothetical protein [Muribaculaceae bacterium]